MSKTNFWKSFFVLLIVLSGFISLAKETFLKNEGTVLAATSSSPNTTGPEKPLVEVDLNQNWLEKKEIAQGFSTRVPVLMYHYVRNGILPIDRVPYILTVTPENLDKQFAFLASNGYQTLSLNDLSESLENKTPLPEKSVVITFDDGYKDFYTDVFPLLKKYNLRAVSFYIANYSSFPGYMNWQMLKEMHVSGLVDIESHTLHHLDLTKMSLVNAVKEIFESKRLLEENLNKKINFFAYPYGSYNETIVSLVKNAGYKLAFSTRPGTLESSKEKYFLKRIGIVGSDTLETFKNKIVNLHQ